VLAVMPVVELVQSFAIDFASAMTSAFATKQADPSAMPSLPWIDPMRTICPARPSCGRASIATAVARVTMKLRVRLTSTRRLKSSGAM
jgi:hypothetical protein